MSEVDGWPPYRDEELPPNADRTLQEVLSRLHAATEQTRRTLNIHYLFLEMKRKQSFADAVNNTSIAPGANIVTRALIVDLVITLATLFDHDQSAIDLRKMYPSGKGRLAERLGA